MPYDKITPPPPSPLTFASAKSWVSNSKSGAYKDYWLQNAPKSYQDLEIDFLPGCPAELSLPRQHVAHIYAARSGHGDFASYHARFDHDSAHNTCSCNESKSPLHFINCRLNTVRLPKPPRGCPSKAIFLLGNPTGASKLTKWLEDSKFFTEICPRISPDSTIMDG
ncbi:hypothetical protein K3495_g1764 [Podosphaera aphanis]|nr:hypothetical protein K3495_g1764 [Podosphaera aphanis]